MLDIVRHRSDREIQTILPSMSSTIILITGANTGLGLATVNALSASQNNYTILLGGRSLEKAKKAASQVEAGARGDMIVEPVQIDIEDDSSIESLVRFVTEKYGRLDVLINNAGMFYC
jgi:NAD(P)-dependent dehydrogenase (short-subunit alcohol dehydrogenase family)